MLLLKRFLPEKHTKNGSRWSFQVTFHLPLLRQYRLISLEQQIMWSASQNNLVEFWSIFIFLYQKRIERRLAIRLNFIDFKSFAFLHITSLISSENRFSQSLWRNILERRNALKNSFVSYGWGHKEAIVQCEWNFHTFHQCRRSLGVPTVWYWF